MIKYVLFINILVYVQINFEKKKLWVSPPAHLVMGWVAIYDPF